MIVQSCHVLFEFTPGCAALAFTCILRFDQTRDAVKTLCARRACLLCVRAALLQFVIVQCYFCASVFHVAFFLLSP